MSNKLIAAAVIGLAGLPVILGAPAGAVTAHGLGHHPVYHRGMLSRSFGHYGTSGVATGAAVSGWHSGGFGGTLSPGWGYRFGPSLGGLGR